MRHMKKVTIPGRIEDRINFVTCDLCGKKIEEKTYVVDEVEVRHKIGSSYPDGGSGEETIVDLCGDCFDTKLIPWLSSQGVKPQTNEWDW